MSPGRSLRRSSVSAASRPATAPRWRLTTKRKYVELAHLQYRAGSTNYIDVLDAQRRYFDAQIGLSNSVRDEHLALVQLYKALGGGWTE